MITYQDRTERVGKLTSLLREVLTILGEDPDREGLRRTPERWAEALLDYTRGQDEDPRTTSTSSSSWTKMTIPRAPTT